MPKLNELSKSVIDFQATGSEDSFSKVLSGVSQWLFTETRKLHHIIGKDECYSVDEDDCRQELLLVLLKAIDRYDHRAGANFFTVLHNHHATATVIERKRKLHQFSAVRSAVDAELDLATLKPTELLRKSHDHGEESKDMLEVSEEYLKLVSCMKSCLSDREFDIIRSRAFGMTLEEVGSVHGVSRERVRQLEKRSLGKIHDALKGFSYVAKPRPVVCDPVDEAVLWFKAFDKFKLAVNSKVARKELADWIVTGLAEELSASA